MKSAYLATFAVLCFFSGCFYVGKDQPEDLLQRWCETWSTRDCLTIILGASSTNYQDPRHQDIRIGAVPYFPSVVAAITWRAHLLGPLQYQAYTYRHTDDKFEMDLDTLMASQAGVYIDWDSHRYLDGRGNYLTSPEQIDSLLFFVSLWNSGRRLDGDADISHLEENFVLTNDAGDTLHPLYVWGRRNERLITEEKLFVRFSLRRNGMSFVHDAKTISLVVTGFGLPIKLDFPVALMR